MTFSEVGEVERLIRDWPWDPLPYAGRGTDGPFEGAVKCGFRTLTKRRWDQLQEEYLLYRQRLLEEITTTFEGNEAAVVTEVGASGGPALEHPTPSNLPTSDTTFPPYPLSCLVLVQNIHSETNKTTLRALLSRALSGTAYTAGLDYIDYRKGTDSVRIVCLDWY